ncbi:MAG: [Fe-S]-binding protein, partial [Desulfobacterales bacterium]|nr:[Fe-S]-binding protein [Desulfobacterales bacterium]
MSKYSSPWIQTVRLEPPSLTNNTADAERLIEVLKSRLETPTIKIDLDLLKTLPAVLRNSQFNIRCVLFKEKQFWSLIGIDDAKAANRIAGLAVDLGTTRVVLRLLDLTTGATLAESAFDNPQEEIGPDILARIH